MSLVFCHAPMGTASITEPVLEALGERYGVDKGLYPPPGPRRGGAMKWIAWSQRRDARPAGVRLRSSA